MPMQPIRGRQSAHPAYQPIVNPAQPIRVGNQPNLDGNQGAGIRFRGGRCYPAAAISPSGSSIAGCYADAAHPGRQSAQP